LVDCCWLMLVSIDLSFKSKIWKKKLNKS
jgi:hypothetical protein